MVKTEKILNDLRQAMQQKQAERVAALRLLVAALKNAQIEKNDKLSEAEEIGVLNKEAKKRQEAAEIYKREEREDLAKKEEAELKVIKEYLPQQMSQAEVKEVIKQMKTSGELGDNFGAAMKAVMAKLKGKADGKLVAQMVKEEL
jgi:hypothetical protein